MCFSKHLVELVDSVEAQGPVVSGLVGLLYRFYQIYLCVLCLLNFAFWIFLQESNPQRVHPNQSEALAFYFSRMREETIGRVGRKLNFY